MKRVILICILTINIISCKEQPKDAGLVRNESQPKLKIIESFIDSLEIGKPKHTKIEVYTTLDSDSIYKTNINFYIKDKLKWNLTKHYEDDQDIFQYIDAQVFDFNEDGFGDFVYRTGTGARGGNSIMNLYIYNPEIQSFTYIMNSKEFPNLFFNIETKSICSYILTGCNETVFLRLENDSLKRRAAINECNDITVFEYDDNGKEKIIFYDSINRFGEFANFINYKPIIVKKI